MGNHAPVHRTVGTILYTFKVYLHQRFDATAHPCSGDRHKDFDAACATLLRSLHAPLMTSSSV